MTISVIPPSVFLILSSLLVPILKGWVKKAYLLVVPILALVSFCNMKFGDYWQFQFLDMSITLGRLDKVSNVFGLIFLIITCLGMLYMVHQNDDLEFMSALFYAGCALGVVLAGDLFSFLVFWEMLTIGAMFLILARRTKESTNSAFRYVMMHVFGGLLMISGVILHIHETGSSAFTSIQLDSLSSYLIFFGMGVNCAWPLFHTWLIDSYPSASYAGVIFLSSFTSKAAIYALIRSFEGQSLLISIGLIMVVFPLFYAVIENDVRRILAYSLVNQLGFMVTAIGVGGPLAINGAVAHAFCHILYKGLLWMSLGSVLYKTGKTKCTELGGLCKTMPLTCAFFLIGALSMSFPFTNGYVSKSVIMSAVLDGHYYLEWLILLFAAAGVFHVAGVKISFFTFFSRSPVAKSGEAPGNMILAMGLTSALCLFIGFNHEVLYSILPNENTLKGVPYNPYDYSHVISTIQLLFFATLSFFMMLVAGVYPSEKRKINLDFDLVYRKSMKFFEYLVDKLLNNLNQAGDRVFVKEMPSILAKSFRNFPGLISANLLAIVWSSFGLRDSELAERKALVKEKIQNGTVSIGFSSLAALVIICVLIVL